MVYQNDQVKYQCMVSISIGIVREEEIMRERCLALKEVVDH
jgi:hypothetical protein